MKRSNSVDEQNFFEEAISRIESGVVSNTEKLIRQRSASALSSMNRNNGAFFGSRSSSSPEVINLKTIITGAMDDYAKKNNTWYRAAELFFTPDLPDQCAMNKLKSSVTKRQTVKELLEAVGNFLNNPYVQPSTKDSLMFFLATQLQDERFNIVKTAIVTAIQSEAKNQKNTRFENFDIHYGYFAYLAPASKELGEILSTLFKEDALAEYVILSPGKHSQTFP